jgi:hypothetical protein
MGVTPRRRVTTLVAILVIAGWAAAAVGAGQAEPALDKTIASYCSSSGDICYGAFARRGRVFLQITTAARYFNRYTLCVTLLPRGPSAENARRCGAFPLLRQRGPTWASSVDFAKQFVGPAEHPLVARPGRYEVSWRQVCSRCTPEALRHSSAGSPLGPSLYFRLPIK